LLVLGRKIGEAFLVMLEDGRTIRVSYEQQRGGSARIGIEAPPEIRVVREELLAADRPGVSA
jgi:carbon storage regulator CsrA